MSKIFEALTKASEEGAGIALPSIMQEQSVVPEPSAAADQSAPEEAAPAVAAAPPPEIRPATPLEPPVAPAPAPAARPAAASGPPLRTARLQVAAGAPLMPFEGNGRSRAGEQYRVVRTKIVQHPAQPRLLVVSSPGPGDGKSVTAVNVAAALALKSDVNVLLIDADFRRPTVAKSLGLPVEPGLADVLAGACPLEDAIIQVEQLPNLYVVPGGRTRSNPAELLDSAHWRAACAVFRKQFHYTVMDAPPIAGVADYDLIQAVCDGVIVVVRPDHTNRSVCFKALETVPADKMMGTLVNCFHDSIFWKAHDYYYYQSEYGGL